MYNENQFTLTCWFCTRMYAKVYIILAGSCGLCMRVYLHYINVFQFPVESHHCTSRLQHVLEIVRRTCRNIIFRKTDYDRLRLKAIPNIIFSSWSSEYYLNSFARYLVWRFLLFTFLSYHDNIIPNNVLFLRFTLMVNNVKELTKNLLWYIKYTNPR